MIVILTTKEISTSCSRARSILQKPTDLATHPPSGLMTHTKLALHFFRRNPHPHHRHQVHDIEPIRERNTGAFEECSFQRVDLRATAARKARTRCDSGESFMIAAVGTETIIPKSQAHDFTQTRVFIGKACAELSESEHSEARQYTRVHKWRLTLRKANLPGQVPLFLGTWLEVTKKFEEIQFDINANPPKSLIIIYKNLQQIHCHKSTLNNVRR